MTNMKYLNIIRKDIYSYFEETTVHGFRYVVGGRNVLERCFWIAVIAVGFYASSEIILRSFKAWDQTPVQTTIRTISMPIEELDFPTITVCNPEALQMTRRNRWMYVEQILNLANTDSPTTMKGKHASIDIHFSETEGLYSK